MRPIKAVSAIATAIAASVAPAFPALAEVCDKVRPHWAPESGPVGQLDETFGILGALLSTGPGITLLGILLLPLLWPNRWLCFLSATLAGLLALALAADWWESEPIYEAAVIEGCRAAPILPIALLVVLCLWLLWRGVSRRRTPALPAPPAG
jgi:hypothetical protein